MPPEGPSTTSSEPGSGAGLPPTAPDDGGDPGTDPTGLGLARALAEDLAARARADPGRRSPSRQSLARLAESAGMPAPPASSSSAPDGGPRRPHRSRPAPSAPGRVGGLATSEPFTGPGAGAGDPTALGSEVARIVGRAGGRERLAVHGLFRRWTEIVGADIGAHCEPTGFVDGVLQVQADSSAWATQLRLFTPAIREAVDRLLGAGTVSRIEVAGPARPSWRHGRLGLRDARGPRDTYG